MLARAYQRGLLGSGPAITGTPSNGLLASLRGRFRDADFAEFYAGQPAGDSVPSSLLATWRCCSTHDKVRRRGQGGLLTSGGKWPWGLSNQTLRQELATGVRAQLILHQGAGGIESSLRLARESGYLKKRSMKVALDTTNILGRGAVKDTCNLLADGIVQLLRTLAAVEKSSVKEWGNGPGI